MKFMKLRDILAAIGAIAIIIVFILFAFSFSVAILPIKIGCIASIEISGSISTSKGYGAIDSEEIVELIGEADKRADVKGILLTINSPGGSVVASREIYSALKRSNKTKVAYMEDIAASGGYFVAVGTDKIFADRGSITGSIGARATFFDMSPLLQKAGINTTVIKSGEMKDIGDLFRPLSEKERKVVEGIINEIAEDFKEIVREERKSSEKFSEAKFSEILDARILTGKQAYEIGLVDGLGTEKDAIEYIGEQTGLGKDPQICKLKPKRDIVSELFSTFGQGIGQGISQALSSFSIKKMLIE